jgi:elongation factor Ts
MATITAAMVNELRAKTGQPMMECKKALTETGGDVEKAVEYFRKKGVKTSITERAATEGRVAVASNSKSAAAVEFNCNTDFTAKSEPVAKLAEKAAAKLLANPSLNLADDAEVKNELTSISQMTGENVVLGRTAVLQAPANGIAGSYLYSAGGKGKVAVILSLAGAGAAELVNQLGMHIAAARPIALTRDQVPADLVAKEKEIAVEQAKASGKPQNIAEKIAEGKMNAFYAERVLLDQEFINAEVFKGKVSDLLKSKGVTLEKYVRLEVGQA